MSIDRCEKCNDQIDTDKDGECYVLVGFHKRERVTVCMCARCRNTHWQEIEHQESA